jgi:hypothetical protein
MMGGVRGGTIGQLNSDDRHCLAHESLREWVVLGQYRLRLRKFCR